MLSSKPTKVRRRLFNRPIHVKSASVCSPLAKGLQEKYGMQSVRVRKGDSVKIFRGEYSGLEGKVTGVKTKIGRISVEGVTREKIAGGTVPVWIHASKILVTALNLDDKWRKEKIERASKTGE